MGYCYNYDKSLKLPDAVVRSLIIDSEDFGVAYLTVCMFITKRETKELHTNIIKHIVAEDMTLDLAPRGHGKSTIGDVDYSITKILRNPNIRIMIGSKTQGQAEAFLKEIRTHYESNEDLLRIFGDLRGAKWTDKEFVVNTRTIIKKEATVTALGSSGQVISKHFDIIIADDLVGFENARTETQRTKVKEWYYNALLPTLEPDGRLHVLGTRYHPLDLYQTLIDSGNYDLQIQRAINIKDGEEVALWPKKYTIEKLRLIKEEAGIIAFGMQYQNDVELAKGEIFKASYFRYYDEYFVKDNEVFVKVKDKDGDLQTVAVKVNFGVDLAISQKETADYFVLMVIGKDIDNNIYVLDYVKARLSFDKQLNTIMSYGYDKFPYVERIGVETVAYQLAMAQELRRTSTLPIIDIKTSKDKVSRAMRRSALFENGKVFFRSNMKDLEETLLLFPEVEHDDLFDALDFAITVTERNNIRVLDRSLFNI